MNQQMLNIEPITRKKTREETNAEREEMEEMSRSHLQKKMLEALRDEPQTDEELGLRFWARKHSTIVSTRNSLVQQGSVVYTGRRRRSHSTGIFVKIWGATDEII